MLQRRRFCSGLVWAGTALGVGACSSTDFRRVRTPREGIPLAYNLAVGASYDGHIRVGSTRSIDGLAELLNQNVECDARLLVMGVDQVSGGRVMRATFRSADIDWTVPPSAGLSRDDFVKLAAEQLRSLDLRFTVSPTGKILEAAVPPERMPPAMVDLFNTLALSVGLGFVEMPAGRVVKGQTWADNGRVGAAGGDSTVDAEFVGLVGQRGASEAFAKFEYSFVTHRPIETETGPRQAQSEGTAKALLSQDGYVSRVKADTHEFDPKRGLAVREIRAIWKKVAVGATEATDIQLITDPCDPDYVGEELCPE